MSEALETTPVDPEVISPPPTVPFAEVYRLVFAASLKELVRRRRLVFIGLVCILPLLVTFMWRMWGMGQFTAEAFFSNLVSLLYLQLLIYIVALAFGVPTVHDEVEGRTITYLLTRPVSRVAVYAGRLTAVQLLAGILLALSLVVCFAIMVVGNPGVLSLEFIKVYINHVLIILFATVVLTGLFAILGVTFRRPLVWGMLYAFGWEGVVAKVPGRLQTWTLDFHIRNLVMGKADVQKGLLDAFRQLLTDQAEISAWTSFFILAVALVAFIYIGGLIFSRKEYVIN
jgi:ABC-type transport system involved in multi-copper enzyme maturation permease subunit